MMPRHAETTAVVPDRAARRAPGPAASRTTGIGGERLAHLARLAATAPDTVAQRARVDGLSARTTVADALPAGLRARIETLSGVGMGDVRVFRNSPHPGRMDARAFALGADIHLAPSEDRHLPHEAWHVVQQKQARVRATRQVMGFGVNDLPGLEREADRMGERARLGGRGVSAAAPARTAARTGDPVLQAVWRNTGLTPDFYRWDRPLAGLRWYASKTDDRMYFIVESLNDANRDVLALEGRVMPADDWLATGSFAMLDGEGVIDDGVATPPPSLDDQPYGPHVFRPVAHSPKENVMTVKTAHAMSATQETFEDRTGTATFAKGLQPRQQNPGIKHQGNVGSYVYHLTTLRNLLMNPTDDEARLDPVAPPGGISADGLDFSKGGGDGGASQTSEADTSVEMQQGSRQHSRDVVAVTTSPINIKMYANQRHTHTQLLFARGEIDERGTMLREPVLLRFRLEKADIDSMELDPMHAKQKTVQLLRGRSIAADRLETLTTEGWSALAGVAAILRTAFFDAPASTPIGDGKDGKMEEKPANAN